MWFKVDDQLWAHPKVLDAGTDAMGLWVRAACWSVQHLTDGFVPEQIVMMLLGESYWPRGQNLADRLVDAGMWDEADDPVGYRFHDWRDYQPPASEVREKRRAISEARAEAGRRGASSRWGDSNDGKRDSKRDGKPMALVSQVDGPEPEPDIEPRTKNTRSTASSMRVVRGDFDKFWAAYPRKVGKRNAKAAYQQALKRASAEQILDGMAQQSWPADPKFVPYPATWLNRDGWDDEPTPQGATASLFDLGEQARRLEEGQVFFG